MSRDVASFCEAASFLKGCKMELKNHEYDSLAICSVRYALGRRTYVVSEISSIVKKMLPELGDNIVDVLNRDIGNAIDEGNTGDPNVDRPFWIELKHLIEEEIDKRGLVTL